MPSNLSKKDKVLTSVARPVAHPERYHKQFWMAGTFFALAVLAYFFLGVLPLVILLVIGVVGVRYSRRRNGRSARSPTRY